MYEFDKNICTELMAFLVFSNFRKKLALRPPIRAHIRILPWSWPRVSVAWVVHLFGFIPLWIAFPRGWLVVWCGQRCSPQSVLCRRLQAGLPACIGNRGFLFPHPTVPISIRRIYASWLISLWLIIFEFLVCQAGHKLRHTDSIWHHFVLFAIIRLIKNYLMAIYWSINHYSVI